MKFAIQRCCSTPVYLKQYESSTDAVLNSLGIEIVDIKEFNCCGYPLKNFNFNAYVLSSARNLSLAEARGLDVITFCNCCYGNLKRVNQLMKEDASIRNETNKTLKKEGLTYEGHTKIRHLVEVLYNDIGIRHIKEKMTRTFKGLKVAVHYGCHILRPKRLVQFNSPGTASVFDQFVEATGAEIVSWPAQLECCGSPMWGVDDNLSMDLAHKKIMDAQQCGAEYICVACSYCHLQFDRVQKALLERENSNHAVPSLLYTQLLGLCLGIHEDKLGIHQNEMDASRIVKYL